MRVPIGLFEWDDYIFLSRSFKKISGDIISSLFDSMLRVPRVWALNMWKSMFGVTDEKILLTAEAEQRDGLFTYPSKLNHEPNFTKEYKNRKAVRPIGYLPFEIAFSYRSDYYLKKIKQLADKHHSKIHFVFTPDYLEPLPKPKLFDYYDQLGEVLIPNLDEIYQFRYWMNDTHLNNQGTKLYTDQIIELLRHGAGSSVYYDRFR